MKQQSSDAIQLVPMPMNFTMYIQLGCAYMQLRKEDFNLPHLAAKLVAIGKEVTHGRGFHLIKCVINVLAPAS